MSDPVDFGRLRPRTLVRSAGRWMPRRRATRTASIPARSAVGLLSRWRPRLDGAVLTRRGWSPRQTLVHRVRPRPPGRTPGLRLVERHTREIRLLTVVVRQTVGEVPSAAAPGVAAAPAPRMRTLVRAPADFRQIPGAAPAALKAAPATAPGAAGPVRRRPAAPPLRAPARVAQPAAAFITPATRARPPVVMAEPAPNRPADARADTPRTPPPTAGLPQRTVPAAAQRQSATPAVDLDDLVDRVLRRIERRAIAQRERLGVV